MALPGPISVAPARIPENQEFGLRPFQRVTAQVLSVNATTAVLSIDGFPVVAQLTSADQAKALLARNSAQFIVTRLSDTAITLRFVRDDLPQAASPPPASAAPELAAQLLKQNNLPLTANNLLLARATLNHQLPVTPGLLNELLGALTQSGTWGAAQADLAAALKAAGLPVTPHSLALAAQQAAQTGQALGNLISALQSAGQGLPPDLLKKINDNLQMLEALVIDLGENPAQVAEKLKAAVSTLGRSPENLLMQHSRQPEKPIPESGLLALIGLGQELEQAGQPHLSGAVEKFLADLRHQHFLNIHPEPAPSREKWSEIGFRLQGDESSGARLRISHESSAIRLILQVDTHPGETVEVDLALAGKALRAQVTAADPLWRAQAETELPSLETALAELGFTLNETQIIPGAPQPLKPLPAAGSAPLRTINIEA